MREEHGIGKNAIFSIREGKKNRKQIASPDAIQIALKLNEAFGERLLFCKRITEHAHSSSASRKRLDENLTSVCILHLRLGELLDTDRVLRELPPACADKYIPHSSQRKGIIPERD